MGKNRFRALVFDLDDTLLDTYKHVPAALEDACNTMIRLGLNATLNECLSERAKYLTSASKSNFFDQLVKKMGIKNNPHPTGTEIQKIITEGLKVFEKRPIPHDLRLVENADYILTYLKEKYVLYLVTSGDPITQFAKIKHCGISDFFSQTFFIDSALGRTKADAFIDIIGIEKCLPSQILCIGDRLDREIFLGRKMGFRTCHVKYGEHKDYQIQNTDEVPDYQINHLKELITKCNL